MSQIFLIDSQVNPYDRFSDTPKDLSVENHDLAV